MVDDMTEPKQKIEILAALMLADDWHAAIKFAAKFPRLDRHRGPILTASAALLSPEVYRQMGRDPEALIAAGAAALRDRFPQIVQPR